MEYQVLKTHHFLSVAKAIAALVRQVNDAIALGWEPVGGISISEKGVVAQAMIKRR